VPLAVDGVFYYVTGFSVVHAVNATTGEPLWDYDPAVAEVPDLRLRNNWGVRGIAYSKGKIYVGTADGRLIAVDARTGKPVWTAQTFDNKGIRYITGAPRIFDGKVIIGHGGADVSAIRGYVTTYDAETGKQLWRFHVVPGNPADGFENKAMEMAAKTWSGEWWKYGGGGTAWNSMTYDPEQKLIYIGTGNGSPWNHQIRSGGKGDNLFLCSVVALDAETGEYRWHYQFNPGESWDYNAVMDLQMADLPIGGKTRKVLMTAPKNGFFYVIDRTNGQLISADPIAKVTWASHVDLKTGRPVENPKARYTNGSSFEMWPSPLGAHSWQPMAYSPATRLVYIPVIESGAVFTAGPITAQNWHRAKDGAVDAAAIVNADIKDPLQWTSFLLAWDPVKKKAAWKIPTPGMFNSGVVATAGGVIFQGDITGKFNAYSASDGKPLWHFDAQAPMNSAPISYQAGGRQYISILTGMSTSAGAMAKHMPIQPVNYYTQLRRVLTFAIDGKRVLPPAPPYTPIAAVEDPDYRPDPTLIPGGAETFGRMCMGCHGIDAVAGGSAPDLRGSAVITSPETFASVVRDGALLPNGMPRFQSFDDRKLAEIRQYLRAEASKLREAQTEHAGM
jgi:quinohemoprotein ethanol dehydrogenase